MNLQQALSQYPIVRRKTWEPDTAIYSREWYFKEKNVIIYRRFPGDYGWQWKPTREDILADDWQYASISLNRPSMAIEDLPIPIPMECTAAYLNCWRKFRRGGYVKDSPEAPIEIDYGPPPLWLKVSFVVGVIETMLLFARWYFHK